MLLDRFSSYREDKYPTHPEIMFYIKKYIVFNILVDLYDSKRYEIKCLRSDSEQKTMKKDVKSKISLVKHLAFNSNPLLMLILALLNKAFARTPKLRQLRNILWGLE